MNRATLFLSLMACLLSAGVTCETDLIDDAGLSALVRGTALRLGARRGGDSKGADLARRMTTASSWSGRPCCSLKPREAAHRVCASRSTSAIEPGAMVTVEVDARRRWVRSTGPFPLTQVMASSVGRRMSQSTSASTACSIFASRGKAKPSSQDSALLKTVNGRPLPWPGTCPEALRPLLQIRHRQRALLGWWNTIQVRVGHTTRASWAASMLSSRESASAA